MSDRFTDSIEPLALATQGRTFEGKVPLADLKRVLPLVQTTDGEVSFKLVFDTDEGGIPRIRGEVRTELTLQCQRCMMDMKYPVVIKVRLGIVLTREAAEHLPDNYEPLVCDEETNIVSVLEDELILALPIVAMHNIEDCSQGDVFVQQEAEMSGTEQDNATASRENPFAVLAKLKKSQSEDQAD